MDGVREIKSFREIPYRRPKKKVMPGKIPLEEDVLKILKEIVVGSRKIPLKDTQEYIEWVNPAYGREVSCMLHEGKYSVQDDIDLHGYSVEEARIQVRDFLRNAQLQGKRCVKIIHGRGLRSVKGPALKRALHEWLKGDIRKMVIAYTTARACDGGLGATYILLRG
jgi:DNA-nicking Smr family endonuclease